MLGEHLAAENTDLKRQLRAARCDFQVAVTVANNRIDVLRQALQGVASGVPLCPMVAAGLDDEAAYTQQVISTGGRALADTLLCPHFRQYFGSMANDCCDG